VVLVLRRLLRRVLVMPRRADEPAADGAAVIPAPGSSYQPAAVQVRLIGPPDVIDAALTLLGDLAGRAWQPSTRKPARSSSEHIQYATLIVPVPRSPR
jgi:hypothetical protein